MLFLHVFISLQHKGDQALYGISVYSGTRAKKDPLSASPDESANLVVWGSSKH